jgi:hypothetical protein
MLPLTVKLLMKLALSVGGGVGTAIYVGRERRTPAFRKVLKKFLIYTLWYRDRSDMIKAAAHLPGGARGHKATGHLQDARGHALPWPRLRIHEI